MAAETNIHRFMSHLELHGCEWVNGCEWVWTQHYRNSQKWTLGRGKDNSRVGFFNIVCYTLPLDGNYLKTHLSCVMFSLCLCAIISTCVVPVHESYSKTIISTSIFMPPPLLLQFQHCFTRAALQRAAVFSAPRISTPLQYSAAVSKPRAINVTHFKGKTY